LDPIRMTAKKVILKNRHHDTDKSVVIAATSLSI
jgi:hypothetical protein